MSYPHPMAAWDHVQHQSVMRRVERERQNAVAAYVQEHQQSNTPEGASGCSQAVVSHEGRAVAARGSRPQSSAGTSSARATVSTCEAAPKNPGINSLTPHAADGAGLGFIGQGSLL